jgi:hypothetical protein
MVAFPAVIAADPHIAAVRRRGADFTYIRRWSYANNNLRKRSSRKQRESK